MLLVPFVNHSARKKWPRYRGGRAGKQVKDRERYRWHYIDKVCPRLPKRDTKRATNSRNQKNCVVIPITKLSQNTTATKNERKVFVPSFLLSNVMSLSPKIDEVRMAICNANLDFVCITESWLKPHIPDDFVSISGFNIIRLDRQTSEHGGVCMYVRDYIRFKILSDIMDDKFEVLWVQIWLSQLPRGIQSIVVGTVYHPPSSSDPVILAYLQESMSKVEARYPNCGVILLGDFNKLDMSRVKNAYGIKQVVPFPTRGNSKLDLVFTNLRAFYDVPIKRPPFGLSDHDTIEIHPLARQNFPDNKFLLKSRDLRATKRLAMLTYLEEVNTNLLVESKVSCEEKCQVFETIIKTGMDIIMPLKSKKIVSNEPAWINVHLKSLIRDRQSAFARGDSASFKRLRNQVNRLRKSCRKKYYASKVEHLKNCEPRKWWTEVKSLSGMKSAVRSDIRSILRQINNGKDIESTSLANTINEAFLAPMASFTPLSAEVNATVPPADPPSVTEVNVFKNLSSLNATKASGPDGIPGWLLKENADLLAPVVTSIINCSLAEGRLPQSWKLADVVPVPKQKPVQDINKHLRPISLTPVLSKVAEDFVVANHVRPAILAKVDPRQFGTVPGSSTTEALVSMVHAWNRATDGNGATVRVVLFDFRKAFDLIDHNILLKKLRTFDICDAVIAWITDFLSSRKQRVKLGQDCFSEWGTVRAGVPQGTKLGPWLFIVMINDLDIANTELWKYVDDTTISETVPKSATSSIQSAVDSFASSAVADKFQLNESKCKEMRISFSTMDTNLDPIVVNEKEIEVVPYAKILGLHISCDLKWNVHVDFIINKCKRRIFGLRQLKCSGLGTSDLVSFFRTCVRPITEYACPVYHDSLPLYLSKSLEQVQRRALRIIYPYSSYEEALDKAGLVYLAVRRQSLTDRLFDKAICDKGSKLHDLLPPVNNVNISLRRQRLFCVPKFKTNRFGNSFIVKNCLSRFT